MPARAYDGGMPRTRAQILEAAERGAAHLLSRTDADPALELGDAYLGRRVADVLTHLHGWHGLFEGWVAAMRNDESPAFPAEGYTWSTLADLNDSIYERFKELDYAAAREAFVGSHTAVVALVGTLEDELLIATDALDWLGNEALGDVAHECLGGHYEWAEGILDAAGAP